MKTLLLSASLLVLATGVAEAVGPAAPDFGQPAGVLPAAQAASAGSIGLPDSLRGSLPAEMRKAVTPGVNPFARPVAATPAPAAASTDAAKAAFQPDVPKSAETDAAAVDEKPDAVDDAALRYYASQRDLERVGAEIRRLKALHPDWQPPTDLFVDKTAANESELWDMYGKKDFAALDRAIAARAKATPGWKPSVDLAGKIEIAKAREAIGSAAERRDWTAVAAAAGVHPSALTCANMDMLWSLGEAYARLGDPARAFDLYAYVLKNCDDPAERLATFQKASLVLPPEGAEALTGFGRPLPNGSLEFASAGFDPLRKAMGKVAAGEPNAAIDAAQVEAFAASIGKSRSQGDAMLLGWYHYAQADYAGAADWFKAAVQLGPDAKAMEGYILALRGGGQLDDAAKLAYANATRSPEIAKIYVEVVSGRLTENDAAATLDEATTTDFAGVVDRSRSALGAQSLGWNRLAHGDIDAARAWFRKSVDWQPTKEGVTGLAVVAARSKDKAELKLVRQRFGDDFPTLASFQVPDAPARVAAKAAPRPKAVSRGTAGDGGDGAAMAAANAAFQAKDYAKALSLLDQRDARFGRNGGAQLLRGWANLKLGRYEEARRVFKQENSRRSTKDTRFGIGAVSNEQYKMWN